MAANLITVESGDLSRLYKTIDWLFDLINELSSGDDFLSTDEWMKFSEGAEVYDNFRKKYEVLNGNKTSK